MRLISRKSKTKCNGLMVVEFALLLPFFAIFVLFVFVFLEMFFRSILVSHASFAAARRVAVQSFGGTPASEYVRGHYTGLGMRGKAEVTSRASLGAKPRIQSVRVTDRYSVLWPSGNNSGIYPELKETIIRLPYAPLNVAGTAAREWNTDNDL